MRKTRNIVLGCIGGAVTLGFVLPFVTRKLKNKKTK